MIGIEEQVMISVSQEYLNGLNRKIQDLEDELGAYRIINKELTDAVNGLPQ
jgi:hypothetical protein